MSGTNEREKVPCGAWHPWWEGLKGCVLASGHKGPHRCKAPYPGV